MKFKVVVSFVLFPISVLLSRIGAKTYFFPDSTYLGGAKKGVVVNELTSVLIREAKMTI